MILPGSRIRKNGVFGTTTDNPLTAGAATFNSAALADLPVVTGNHAIITLDPLKQFGNPEIVMVTAHTAAATVATITRGMFGTVARSHPVNTLWVHAAAQDDFIEIFTSSTRPADQYEGQFGYETDTNKLVGFGGVDWAYRDAGGQLTNGYAQAVANQGTFTAATDITGLSVTVTIPTARRINIVGSLSLSTSVAGDTAFMLIQQDGATIQSGIVHLPATGGSPGVLERSLVLSPSAGSHTYKIQAGRNSGTGVITSNASANTPAFILVEDIGAA